jgi:hypothetical protein
MAEYRVNALHYRFTSGVEHDDFAAAEPAAGSVDGWNYTLKAGVLRAVPVREFRDRDEARDDLEPHLRAWEQVAFLTPNNFRVKFEYERADVEEVDPKPGSVTVFPEPIRLHFETHPPSVVIGHRAYPTPDPRFLRSSVTDNLSERPGAFAIERPNCPPSATTSSTSLSMSSAPPATASGVEQGSLSTLITRCSRCSGN